MFRLMSTVTAAVCAALFVILFFAGDAYVATYGVVPGAGTAFVAARAAPMFIGLAVILWCARDLPVGPGRDAVCLGMLATWWGIAVSGVIAYATGAAQGTILIAALAEVLIGALFMLARRR